MKTEARIPRVEQPKPGPKQGGSKQKARSLRFSDPRFERLIEEARKTRDQVVSANTWILEAIAEKLERELRA